jgi:glycosyltransferase involved in cell wall biosynthesis
MKVYLAAYQPERAGGGWSFQRNLAKSLGDDVTTYDQADVYFVAGASMLKPEEAEQAKRDGKKVVLRVDNALKHSRNQGKGMDRLQRMAAVSDMVIYQCQWAKDYLGDFLGNPTSRIIYNGVDMDIFTPGDRARLNGSRYLYSCSSKGETKRWEWVWWRYQQIQKEQPEAALFNRGKYINARDAEQL